MRDGNQPKHLSEETRHVIALVAELVWCDPAMADMISARRKGWLAHLSNETGVERSQLKRAISDMGENDFAELVAGNPAGVAPMVILSDIAMASTHGSCLHGTGTCGSCLHGTGTCGTCAACYAPDGNLLN